MKKTFIAIIALCAFLLLGTIVTGGYALSIYNDQAGLKNQYEMKLVDNNNQFDNVWKTISQACQIAESKKDAFKDIFTSYAAARTSDGQGKVMSWIKENAPTVDLKVFDNAQNIIVASRQGFTMRQTELISVASVYNGNLATQPRGFLLGVFGFKHIDPKIVTSSRTQAAFDSGKDDDTTLFKK